jgi:hypothetical protein
MLSQGLKQTMKRAAKSAAPKTASNVSMILIIKNQLK